MFWSFAAESSCQTGAVEPVMCLENTVAEIIRSRDGWTEPVAACLHGLSLVIRHHS